MKKQNNIFGSMLTFLFLLNCVALAIVAFGQEIVALQSVAIAILVVNCLMFAISMIIVGQMDDEKDEKDGSEDRNT